MGILTEQRAGSFFRSESSSGFKLIFFKQQQVFFSSPRSRKPEDAAPGRRTCYRPGLFSCPVRNTHHGGGGSGCGSVFALYMSRGGAGRKAPGLVLWTIACPSFLFLFIYLLCSELGRLTTTTPPRPRPSYAVSPSYLFIYIVLVDDTPPAAPMSPLVGAGLPPAGPARRGEPSPRPRSTTTRSGESSGVAGGIGGAHGSQMVLGGADGRSSTRCSPRMYS